VKEKEELQLKEYTVKKGAEVLRKEFPQRSVVAKSHDQVKHQHISLEGWRA
jgi:hypothetical protein